MDKIIELSERLDCSQVYEELSHPSSGGVCVFIGSVRDLTDGEAVTGLFFEAYEEMAVKEMNRIADEAIERWNLNKVVIRHALGNKKIEDPVVIVGASSAHRDGCFAACRYMIDTLKEQVPIWKKEYFKHKKEVWVTERP